MRCNDSQRAGGSVDTQRRNLESVVLGDCIAMFHRNPLHDGHAWLPAAFMTTLFCGALAMAGSGSVGWASSLVILGLISGVWLSLSLRRILSSHPLILFTNGFYYHDGSQSHTVRFSDVVAFRADLRGAHDPRPWARAYGFFIETAEGSIYVGWGIRHTDRALSMMKSLLPKEVVREPL